MDEEKLWQAFAQSGKVEDYLRYRGIAPGVVEEERPDGDKIPYHDRRPHSAEL